MPVPNTMNRIQRFAGQVCHWTKRNACTRSDKQTGLTRSIQREGRNKIHSFEPSFFEVTSIWAEINPELSYEN